jgi:plastocyanin
MALQAGEGQTAVAGTAVAEAPAVLVFDNYDNPVNGLPVRFRVASGGGRVEGGEQITGADGIARVESWTVGNRPGPNTLTATSVGLAGSPVTFTATAAATGAIVEVRNNYFHSLQNGSGLPVTFSNMLGKPAIDTISPGQTVTWVWVGQHHNVSPLDPFDYAYPPSGDHDAPHRFSVTFTSPGSYFYRCTNHSFLDPFSEGPAGMLGTIEVR